MAKDKEDVSTKMKVSEFGQNPIRRVWHNEEWYYSIVDVIGTLTESKNPRNYWVTLKARTKTEGFDEAVAQIETLKLKSSDNRLRSTDTANRQTLLRIIQSIPSPTAEPFRLWLAEVGEERFAEVENPELILKRMRDTYRAKGYDDAWIEERIKNNIVRNELTDEWRERGAKEGVEYAILTNEISEGTFNLSVQAYKQYKLLPNKENLRDHMNTMELVLCSLGEATAALYHRDRDSQGLPALRQDAQDAGSIAGETRKRIEENRDGKSVVTPENHLALTAEMERAAQLKKQEERKQLKQGPQLSMFNANTPDKQD